MKKRIISVSVLLTVALFMFVSCSGSITDTLLKVMDGTKTNVFEQAGLVKPDTAAADNAVQALKSETVAIEKEEDGSVDITKKEEFKAIADLGIEVKITGELANIVAEKGVLAPHTTEQKKQISDAVFGSEKNQEKFKTELEKPVTDKDADAVKGSMVVASVTFNAISTKVGTETEIGKAISQIASDFADMATGESTITEGDKACVQLATNVAVSAAEAIDVLNNSSLSNEQKMKDDKVVAFINDANLLYATSKLGVGNVGDTVQDLLGKIDINNVAGSKDINVDIPDTYKKMIPNLVKNLLGEDVLKYDSKIRSFKSMVNSKNAMFMVVSEKVEDLGSVRKDYADLEANSNLTAIIEYMAATAVSQLDAVKYKGVSFLELIKDVVEHSGSGFFNDLSSVKASEKNEALIKSLFAGSDKEIKTVLKDLLVKMQVNALTADKMMIIGDVNISSFIGTKPESGIVSISEYLNQAIADLSKTE